MTSEIKTKKPKMTAEEIKEYRKMYARKYYANPEKRALQNEKMRLYREKNRAIINAKKRAKNALARQESLQENQN